MSKSIHGSLQLASLGGNEKKIKKRPSISRIWLDAPLWLIDINFWLRVHHVDVISCAKFYCNRLIVFCEGQILLIFTGVRCRR